jgi:tetratricopeptide (TPR) repeat protein
MEATSRRLIGYAHALVESGDFAAAAWLLRQALDLSDWRDGVVELAAACLLEASDPGAARDALVEAARRDGWTADRRRLLAMADRAMGRANDALEEARRAAVEPDAGVYDLAFLAELQAEVGQLTAARRSASSAIRIAPDSPVGYLAQALVANEEGELQEEIECLERAIALGPDDPHAATRLGAALVRAGRREEGQRTLAKVVARRPGDRQATLALMSSTTKSRWGTWVVAAMFFAGPVIVWLGGSLLLSYPFEGTPQWGRGFLLMVAYVAALLVGLQVFERRRTEESVRRIKADAWRALRKQANSFATLKRLGPGVVIAIGMLWIYAAMALSTNGLGRVTFHQVFVVGLPGWLLVLIGALLLRRRKVNPEGFGLAAIDPSVCQCHRVQRAGGPRAQAYADRHLVPDFSVVPGEVDQLSCEVLHERWLLFKPESGLQRGQSVLIRLPREAYVLPPDESGEGRVGFYL